MPIPMLSPTGTPLQVDGSQRAARVTYAPFDVGVNGAYIRGGPFDAAFTTQSSAGANGVWLSLRNASPVVNLAITRLALEIAGQNTATANIIEVFKVTSFTVDYTNGTVQYPIKKRNSMPPAFASLRVNAAGLTGATVTVPGNPVWSAQYHSGSSEARRALYFDVFGTTPSYPLWLTQNEGLIIRVRLDTSTSTEGFRYNLEWMEVPTFSNAVRGDPV